ncbi:hypothetical protein Agub_g10212 [Astrephomene gubernaculifera]|uniref:Uncharacterized protein n=1 Tax=Astrephomene gubernaculifera TaxID=47775 RepID=A0AAD3DUE6_9CHLO|nr:hypothetical protein Agub_g10212 [Astrephomene gubernaculifera]
MSIACSPLSLSHSCNAMHRGGRIKRARKLLLYASASGAIPHNGAGGVRRPDPNRNVCGVFQITGSPVWLTLNDVRDAYEACSPARSVSERRQCFEVYGLDADKVDRYYDRVCEMERLIDHGDAVAQQMVASGGAVLLYFMAYCILKV